MKYLQRSSSSGSQTLFLHDIPEFVEVGLSDEVVWFELQRTEVVALSFLQLPIKMEDGPEIHQSCWVLGEREKQTQKERIMDGLQNVVIELGKKKTLNILKEQIQQI